MKSTTVSLHIALSSFTLSWLALKGDAIRCKAGVTHFHITDEERKAWRDWARAHTLKRRSKRDRDPCLPTLYRSLSFYLIYRQARLRGITVFSTAGCFQPWLHMEWWEGPKYKCNKHLCPGTGICSVVLETTDLILMQLGVRISEL